MGASEWSCWERQCCKGLIRVKKGSFIGQLLSASGRSHDGGRFFLDPLVWEGAPVCVKPFVSWIEKDPLEKDSAYAARVAKLAIEHGAARGWRQLGVRSMSEESKVVTKRSQSWVLRSAPRHWDADDVVRFLQAAQFTAVELNVKKREQFGTTWGFKAFSGSSQSYLQLLYEGSSFDEGRFVVVERYRNPRLQSNVTKLKGEFRVDLRQEPPSPDDFPPLATTLVETKGPEEKPDSKSQDNVMDETEGGKRSTAAPAGASPDRKRLKVQPLPEGVLRISNEGLGNCLFIAVAQSVEATSQQQHSHRSIRAAAVKHLRKHRDQYFMWSDNLWPDGSKCGKETIDGFDEYVGKVAQIGAWAGNLWTDRCSFSMKPVRCTAFALRDRIVIFSFTTVSRKVILKLSLLVLKQL